MAADGFCPKCGAVLYDGVCASCGYGRAKKHKNYSSGQKKTKKSSSQAGIVVLVVVILILVGTMTGLAVAFSQVQDVFSDWTEIVPAMPAPEPEPESVLPDGPTSGIYDWSNDWNFEWGEDFEDNYEFEEYVPDLSDDFYKEIVSTTVRGLDYDIAWNSNFIYPDDDNSYASFSCIYPSVINSELSFVEEINAAIKAEALSYKPVAMEGDNFGYVDCYVTYMTSGLLSVVFVYDAYEGEDNQFGISALNFDMVTGEQLTMEEMLPTYDFIDKYRETCEVQNGIELDNLSDDEIMAMITNPETGVAFYNPVGIDIGFNYPEGWMTVTLK